MDSQKVSREEFEKIEAYLNGDLSKDEILEFETQLNTDTIFRAKFDDIKTVLTGIETQSLKEQLDIFHKELSANEQDLLVNDPKVKSLHWRKIAVAAILIVGLGSFWLFSGSPNEKLYSEYFTPDPGLPTTMSNTNNYDFYEAMVSYKQGDYKVAIDKWQALQNTKPNNDTLNYFIGVAHLANKNEKTAISFLENASKNSEFPLINDVYYYLGLAYLKDGNIDRAKNNFKNSTLENSKALLSKLND